MEELPYVATPEEAEELGLARAEEADGVVSTAHRAEELARRASDQAVSAERTAREKAEIASKFLDDWVERGGESKGQEGSAPGGGSGDNSES